ncbi:hypothetical protein D2Q93_04405 [Alicyclobacillaceae bacterium I2511]|nr:hypothetical protein D2Q93_04405 [Alicyclobacillaceae bacterium I2511]
MMKKILLMTAIGMTTLLCETTYGNTASASTLSANTSSATTETAQQLGVAVHIPSSGFNPLTATNGELKAHGFPTKPTNPSLLSAWKTAMEHSKRFIIPTFKSVISTHHYTTNQSTASGSASSHNWSGYYAYNGYNYNGYTDVRATWTVPNATTGGPGGPNYQYSCTWVGIGGNGNPDLIQMGTEADLTITLRTYVMFPNYYPWFEILPKYPYQQDLTNMVISAGDKMYADVSYSNSTAYFYLVDETTNVAVSFSDSGDSSDYNGSTAEWIVERTEENNSYPHLTDFGSEVFTSAAAGSVTEPGPFAIGDWPNNELTMSEDGLTMASANNPLTTVNSFTDYWKNYGNIDPVG